MKQQATIINVRLGCDNNGQEYFDCFMVKRPNDKRSIYLEPDLDQFPELEDMTQDELVEWAKDQIGKTIFFEGATTAVYYVTGKNYIV